MENERTRYDLPERRGPLHDVDAADVHEARLGHPDPEVFTRALEDLIPVLGRGDAHHIAKRMDDPEHPQWSALRRSDPELWQHCRDEIERAHEWGYRAGEKRRSCIEATGDAEAREAREALASAIDPEYAACVASPAARAEAERERGVAHPLDCDEPAAIHQMRLGSAKEGQRCEALGDLAAVLEPAQAERLWREIEDHGTAYGSDVTRAMGREPSRWNKPMEMLDAARHGRTRSDHRADAIASAHKIWTLRETERSTALTPPEETAGLAHRTVEMPEGGPRARREAARVQRAGEASEAPARVTQARAPAPSAREGHRTGGEARARTQPSAAEGLGWVRADASGDPAQALAIQIHATRTSDPDEAVRAAAWRGLATLIEPSEAARAMGESDEARRYAGQTLRRNVMSALGDDERARAIEAARAPRGAEPRAAEAGTATTPGARRVDATAPGRGASEIARGFRPRAARAQGTGADRAATPREEMGR